ncbi:MAG: hypothetical protein P8X97_03470 [Candidatus Bathyarchaeota archaeon]|jgi:hypothetical protein
MKNTPLMEKRNQLKQVMTDTFQNEIQSLNSQLQSILIDDMTTAFLNRLNVMKKIQANQ